MSDDNIHVPPQYSPPPYYGGQGAPEPTRPHERGWSGGAIVAAAVAGALIGGILMAAAMLLLFGPFGLGGGSQGQQNPGRVPSAATTSAAPIGPSEGASDTDQPIERVAKVVTPSVVNIAVQGASGVNPFTGQPMQSAGNGSGVIIRQDGYILTNNHVVEGANKISVTIGLNDYAAKVVGTDPTSDIAVIKIEKAGLTPAALGDSNSVQVGETVVAIGSPFGLDRTVTSGIVSALHRSGEAASGQSAQSSTIYSNLIQTDAPINPGNSGGALCNLAGQVIGVNTLIQTGGAQQSAGIGFAIPINIAKQVADQLISPGKATHTFLGVGTVDAGGQGAGIPGVASQSGALVQQVQPNSPAAKAGIQRGDVVVKIGDEQIQTASDLVAAVRSHQPGDEVPIVVDRNGKQLTLNVKLGSSS